MMKMYTCNKCREVFASAGVTVARVCPFCQTPLNAQRIPIDLSICAPMWCEECVVEAFVERAARAALSCSREFEIIIVDDGSRDATWEKIARLSRQKPYLRGIRHSRNFGLQAAVTTALQKARGRAVVIIDGDLEDPPELIPTLYQKWRDGANIVYTVKEDRRAGVLKGLLFKAFYSLFTRLASPPMIPQSGLFCLLDRRVVDVIAQFPERVRYIPGLRTWVGFSQAEVHYSRDRRYDATPRQSLFTLVQMAIEALTSFSSAPLQFGLGIGVLSCALSLIAILVIVCIRAFTSRAIPGWSTYTTLLIGLGGFLSLYISIIGCYLGHVYIEVKRRPHSLIAEEIGGPFHEGDAAATI